MTDWVGRTYDRYAERLFRYAAMILADRDAAADAVHQVFTKLLRERGRAVTDDERYLRRAVRNECYSALRRRLHERPPATPLLEPLAPGQDPDTRLAIEQALRGLPPEQREVVHLKVFEGRTLQEIADLIGESINTVASRYRYAIDKLRAQLRSEAAGHE